MRILKDVPELFLDAGTGAPAWGSYRGSFRRIDLGGLVRDRFERLATEKRWFYGAVAAKDTLIGFAIGLGCQPGNRRSRVAVPQRRSYPALVAGCLLLSTALHFGWNVIAYGRADALAVKLIPMMVMLAISFAFLLSLSQITIGTPSILAYSLFLLLAPTSGAAITSLSRFSDLM